MEKWVIEKLSVLMDFPIDNELAKYIIEMKDERELENYLTTLMDIKNPSHRQFITELKKQLASYNQTQYKKVNNNDTRSNKQNEKKRGKAKAKENIQFQTQEVVKPEKPERKNTKFVDLYSQGDILLKGRHKCDCEARKHKLINNCLNCGRIVCFQEGAGPCFFCGELVCSPKEQFIIQSNSKQANTLYNKLMNQKPSKNLEDSLKQRDKLLEYDRNSTRRTKVIDDETDYYQSHSVWLSDAERKKLQKEEAKTHACKHKSRLDKKIAIDFMGRVVTVEDQAIIHDSQLQEFDMEEIVHEFENPNICPTIEFDRPTFIETGIPGPNKRIGNNTWNRESRVQDKEYLEISDQGLCLSLRQPYASLLVAGIKTHEGRTWYSAHRGRLWIASATKTPSVEEIYSIQHSYEILKDEKFKFPDVYPTGSLLGCVTVTDVLCQEDYRKLYPEGECDSPYVFVCENCYKLPIHFPMKGKDKIYKLEKGLHQAASKCLQKIIKSTYK